MKKLLAFISLFLLCICAVAVIGSPLLLLGKVRVYSGIDDYSYADGIVYGLNANARVDFKGSESDMFDALDLFCEQIVKVDKTDELTIVYAHSLLVKEYKDYNVMACYTRGNIVIATPVIPGSY